MDKRCITHMGAETVLYAGLSWQVLLGSSGLSRLINAAHLAKQSHYVVSGDTFQSFGAITQFNIDKRGLLSHHSAAACLAAMAGNKAMAVVLQLVSGDVLLLAVSDGAVLLKGDQCFDDPAQAREAVQALTVSSPQLKIQYVDDGEAFLESLHRYCSEVTELKQLPRQRGRYPLYVGAGFCTLLGACLWHLVLGPSANAASETVEHALPVVVDDHSRQSFGADPFEFKVEEDTITLRAPQVSAHVTEAPVVAIDQNETWVEPPKLRAIYGVGKRLLAEFRSDSATYLYIHDQEFPIGHAMTGHAFRLVSMDRQCVTLKHLEQTLTQCLHASLVQEEL